MIDINNFAEGTTFEYEGKFIEIHYDVRSLIGIRLATGDCCALCCLRDQRTKTCWGRLSIIHGSSRRSCRTINSKGFRFYYRLKEVDNVESNGQDASSKDRVD